MGGLVGDLEVGGEEGVVVDFDDDTVVAGILEGQIANLIDEVDALNRALRLEGTFDQRLKISRIESHGEFDGMVAFGHVAERQKPHHERMGERELAAPDIRKYSEDGVFAGGGVDVDAVASEPGKDLWFGLHERPNGGGSRRTGKREWLGERTNPALLGSNGGIPHLSR